MWETQIISLTQGQDLLGFINGETPMPGPKVESFTGRLDVSSGDGRKKKGMDSEVESDHALASCFLI